MVRWQWMHYDSYVLSGLVVLLGAADIAARGQGVILWDESLSGELSKDYTHPTSLSPIQPGTNSIIGVVIFNRGLTTGERDAVAAHYLRGRFGLW